MVLESGAKSLGCRLSQNTGNRIASTVVRYKVTELLKYIKKVPCVQQILIPMRPQNIVGIQAISRLFFHR